VSLERVTQKRCRKGLLGLREGSACAGEEPKHLIESASICLTWKKGYEVEPSSGSLKDLVFKIELAEMSRQPARENSGSQLSSVQGQIERVTFYNEETDFTIARLKAPEYRDLITLVGAMMAPTPGQVVRATGQWRNHPKFGEQFKVLRYTTLVPATSRSN
jgi:hypothetical protein